jgi:type I restriction-modification system DNA methylase subunit
MQLRSDFLDPMFELMGWDIKNRQTKLTGEREVVLEESLKSNVKESAKKPDYTFRLFSERKFFLEAKKPNISIEKNNLGAKQIRRYGFTAKLKISVLSNFEYLIIYDCSVKVDEEDDYRKARLRTYHYMEYEEKFEELKSYIGRESVYSGQFDEMWKDIDDNLNRFSVDDLFLEHINEWRWLLGTEILRYSPGISVELLNDYVQNYLNGIIFLRVCEDRGLEISESLLQLSSEKNFEALLAKFAEADKKYNAGLFQLRKSDKIIGNIHSVFRKIIKDLYYPESPYSFSVFSSDILGNIYEIFLAEKLDIKDDAVILERKPEAIDKDIITTPTYIIREILKQTIVPLCNGKNAGEILEIRIADIACGSGAFLLEAFQLLNNLLIDVYLASDKSKLVPTGVNSYKLPFELKKKLLLNCIHGVDKDYNAVEAAKFGLLLKLLEDETRLSVGNRKPLLPELSNNVFFGNALVDSKETGHISEIEKRQINPFDFKDRKYDVIIGNPPYMKSEDMKRLTPLEHGNPYKNIYTSAYKQYDKYFLFIERALSLLNDNGSIGYIVPNKFLKVGAGKKLRHLLVGSGHVKRIISFGANQVFKSKTTYTCILILEKKRIENCGFYEVKDLKEWKISGPKDSGFEHYPTAKLEDDVWVFVPPYLKGAFNEINSKGICLVELLGRDNIFNGIQTSRNSIYVITPIEEDQDYIYFKNKGQSWKVEKELTRPYYETPKGKSQDRLYTYRILEPNRRVIFPYQKNDKGVEVIREAELRLQYPHTFHYFFHFKPDLLKRDVKPPIEHGDWYKFGRGQSLDKWDSPVKIVIGVNSMGEKYALDFSHTFISSGGTAGYCGITMPYCSDYSVYYIQALLNSKYLEWYSSLIGEVFRGGYIARGT